MKSYLRNPVHLVALSGRYGLIQLTRLVRKWEKRPLKKRKQDVLLVFGTLLLVMLANLFQHLNQNATVVNIRSAFSPSDSTAHHQLYMNELQNRKPTQPR